MEFKNVTKEDAKKFFDKYLLTIPDALAFLGCSKQYLHKLTSAGRLVPIKSTSKEKIFFKKDLEDYRKNAKPGRPRKPSWIERNKDVIKDLEDLD